MKRLKKTAQKNIIFTVEPALNPKDGYYLDVIDRRTGKPLEDEDGWSPPDIYGQLEAAGIDEATGDKIVDIIEKHNPSEISSMGSLFDDFDDAKAAVDEINDLLRSIM